MVTKGLLVKLEAAHGKRDELRDFLTSALPLVQHETGTTAWWAVQFGRSHFGIFDAFPDDMARDTHLAGAVASALMARGGELLDEAPEIIRVDILASKLPQTRPVEPNTRGVLLTFEGKPDNLGAVEEFMVAGRALVEQELETIAWFALRLPDGKYGVFDVFPDNGARFAHLTGRVPQALMGAAFELLGGMPDIDLFSVLAEKLDSASATALAETPGTAGAPDASGSFASPTDNLERF